MKKSHEYDSPVLSKLVSIVTILAICVCSICCIVTASKVSNIATGGVAVQTPVDNGASKDTSSTPSQTPSNDAPADNSADAPADNNADAPADNSADAPAADANKPDNAAILAEYTKIMDGLKSSVIDGKVSQYNKKEFQTLADDYDLGTVGNLVLPIAQNLMTSEDEAEEQVRTDYEQIPIVRNKKGCLLTDASAIKSAKMTEAGGKTTIEIVLNDEKGSLPAAENATSCSSIVGSVFNPLNQEEIDNIVAEFSGVVTMNKFELTCKDCTTTLVYDTATGKVESLTQIMNYYIDVDAKAVFVPVSGYATLTNKMTIYNVQYK
ncbi:MAG: hypothetical protein IKV76_09640 [Clostridia bacterium]|nr:hypothetical protein [Clostridia bacterium]